MSVNPKTKAKFLSQGLLFLTMVPLFANSPFSWRSQIETAWIYDQNLADNYLQVPGNYVEPSIDFQFYYTPTAKHLLRFELSNFFDFWVEERSPLLSSPLYQHNFSWRYKFLKSLSSDLYLEEASLYNQDLQPVKNFYRIAGSLLYKTRPWSASTQLKMDFEDYGNTKQDGYTYWFEGSIERTFKVSRHSNIDLSPRWRMENRRSNASLYTYVKNQYALRISGQFHHFGFYVEPGLGQKSYAYTLPESPNTSKENKYILLRTFAKYDLLEDLQIYAKWNFEEQSSNQDGSNFSDGTFAFGFRFELIKE